MRSLRSDSLGLQEPLRLGHPLLLFVGDFPHSQIKLSLTLPFCPKSLLPHSSAFCGASLLQRAVNGYRLHIKLPVGSCPAPAPHRQTSVSAAVFSRQRCDATLPSLTDASSSDSLAGPVPSRPSPQSITALGTRTSNARS